MCYDYVSLALCNWQCVVGIVSLTLLPWMWRGSGMRTAKCIKHQINQAGSGVSLLA